MDINGTENSGGAVRGPFDVVQRIHGRAPTYPILWAHETEAQQTVLIAPDTEGSIRSGANKAEDKIIREKAKNIWDTASRCHFNRDFQFNSQSTAVAVTARPSIGGRAWPSISFDTVAQEKTFALWMNSSLGLLLYWWYSNKQQSGRVVLRWRDYLTFRFSTSVSCRPNNSERPKRSSTNSSRPLCFPLTRFL